MKQFFKLTVKCILVLLPVILLCNHFRTHLLSFIDDEGPHYLWNKDFSHAEHEKQYNVIIIGDSSANASYVPEYLSDDTVNLSLGGLSPVENYYTLKDWLDHNEPPKVCYISFYDSLLSFDGFFWTRAFYAHRYSLQDNIDAIKTAFAFQEETILKEHPILEFLSYEFYLPNKYMTPFLNASFNQRYESNVLAYQADDLHSGRYISRVTREYYPGEPPEFDQLTVNPIFDYYYRGMIELCYEHGITVRIVKLPLPENTIFGPEYEESFYGYYDALQEDYPDLTVDWFPLYPKDMFQDDRHVNAHGALRFSAELKALYPDDFSNEAMSDRRINAINDSVALENRIPEVLEWIRDKDYTMVVYDGSGQFRQYYETDMISVSQQEEKLEIQETAVQGLEDGGGTAYYISGLQARQLQPQPLRVSLAGESLSIQTEGGTSLPWDIKLNNQIWISVVDNYNGQIVFSKAFRLSGKTLVLA